MSTQGEIEIGRLDGDDDAQTYMAIASQALFFPQVDLSGWFEREGPENARVARLGGRIAGGLTMQRMGQWFGGRSVPMTAVRVVAVAPEHRASGVASRLMRAALEEMYADGVALSVLYPATQPVYRRQGYEQAGVRMRYSIPLRSVEIRDRELDLTPIEAGDRAAIRKVYAERARRTAGNLDRSDWYWDRIFLPPPWGDPIFAYAVQGESGVEGYVVYSQKSDASLCDYQLQAVDLVFTTPRAAHRLLTLLVDHRSMAESVTFWGAPADPLLMVLTEQLYKVDQRIDWMLRVVNVPAAIEARGYPIGVTGELHLQVADDVLPQNHRKFIVEVADGSAHVREGGRGDLKIDVRGLAPLYSGHLSPLELKSTGYINGPDDALAIAAAIFSGPAPWMPDDF